MSPLTAFAGLLFSILPDPSNSPDSEAMVRNAVQRGLDRVTTGATSYLTHRQCFSCHHQALTVRTLVTAQQHGFAVDPDVLEEQVDATLETFRSRLPDIAKGRGVGGGSTMAGYALWTLAAVEHPDKAVRHALIQYLLKRQQVDGHWQPLPPRPPSQGSQFTDTALALSALQDFAQDHPRSKLMKRTIDQATDWLFNAQPKSTEDHVFYLHGLLSVQPTQNQRHVAISQLFHIQRKDGGWGQTPDRDSDAYATATAMVALRRAGVPRTDTRLRNAMRYLLEHQRDDGAWLVTTHSQPVQVFFDNGDPGGKSQFISFAATGWATLALLTMLENARESEGGTVEIPNRKSFVTPVQIFHAICHTLPIAGAA